MGLFDKIKGLFSKKKISSPKKTKDKNKFEKDPLAHVDIKILNELIKENKPGLKNELCHICGISVFKPVSEDDYCFEEHEPYNVLADEGSHTVPVTPEEYQKSLIDNVEVIDLRGEQPNPPLPSAGGKIKWRIRNGKVVERRFNLINGICVHQTAARFGVSEAAIRDAGGDRKLALARRSKGVACHVMAFADGFVAWPNELAWYVWHGNAFNAKTIGIEIDGDFAGLINDPTTAFRKKDNPDVLTPQLKAAACRGIKLIVEEGRKLGMPIEYIYAHRQSSPTRRSDPGEQIWREVVLGYAVKELGLKVKPFLIQRKGYSIPWQWNEVHEDGEILDSGDYWDDPKR